MGNFFLGLLGAAVGGMFGIPAVGFGLGSGLGSMLGGKHSSHPSTAPVFEGTRLQDLKIQTSTYGIAIPQVYGTYRLAGNLIWGADIVEKPDPARRGNYLYFAQVAIGLCAGPIVGIRRVWADGKLLLGDDRSESLPPYPPWLRVHSGSETQMPDPLIEKHLGLGQVPAFRGLAYLVLENFPLAAFTNRLPTFSVEVVQHAVTTEKPSLPIKGKILPPTIITIPVPVPLAEVVQAILVQAGFSPDAIDVSALFSEVAGFVLSQPTSAQEALGFLQAAYFFDMIEAGFTLKCIPRGQPVLEILATDTCAFPEGEQQEANFITTRVSSELPPRLTVFFTRAPDYALMTQSAERQMTRAKASATLTFPLVLTVTQAARIAEALLQEAWIARTHAHFTLSRRYAHLEPGDVVNIQELFLRITRTEVGGGVIRCQAVAEDPSLYAASRLF